MTAGPLQIVEVGPRDGFQSIDEVIPTATKHDLIEKLYEAGIRRMEATAFVSSSAVPQLADAADVMRRASALPGLDVQVLVPNLRNAAKALDAGADHLAYVLSVSERHNQNNVRRTPLESVEELFSALRYDDEGMERAEFVLNRKPWTQAGILVTGENFGCGSSREHAPWALLDFGIRCIIAPSFADIFYNNCFKNGILPIVVEPAVATLLMADAGDPGQALIAVDLRSRTMTRANGQHLVFEIDSDRRDALLTGRDDIGQTLLSHDAIAAWERNTGELWGRDIPAIGRV